jgi:hypothetical protein
VTEAVTESDPLLVVVPVGFALRDGVRVAGTDLVAEPDAVCENVAEVDAVTTSENVIVLVAVKDGVTLPDLETELERVEVAVFVTVAVSDAVKVPVRVPDSEGEAAAVYELVMLLLTLADIELLAVGDREGGIIIVTVPDGDIVPLPVPENDGVTALDDEGEGLPSLLSLAVGELDGDAVF